jgi:hypothetical protein
MYLHRLPFLLSFTPPFPCCWSRHRRISTLQDFHRAHWLISGRSSDLRVRYKSSLSWASGSSSTKRVVDSRLMLQRTIRSQLRHCYPCRRVRTLVRVRLPRRLGLSCALLLKIEGSWEHWLSTWEKLQPVSMALRYVWADLAFRQRFHRIFSTF